MNTGTGPINLFHNMRAAAHIDFLPCVTEELTEPVATQTDRLVGFFSTNCFDFVKLVTLPAVKDFALTLTDQSGHHVAVGGKAW